jgi:tetratricopeptide (TPR) repeat protein
MKRLILLTGLGLLVLLLAGAALAVIVLRPWGDKPEYAGAPFHPVGKDYPRILRVKERLSKDELDAVCKYLTKDGAIRHASAEEQEAVAQVTEGNYIWGKEHNYVKAGELAAKVLQANPESIPGLFVQAHAEHYGEANLPRALFQIRQARHLLEKRGQADPADADSREWYLRVLEEEYHILSDMDRREEQIQIVVLLEKVYQPLPWLKVFPLIKLKRYDEARQAIEQMEKDGNWKLRALNSRCMLEEQLRHRHGCYLAGKDMVEKEPTSAVLWNNYGLSCLNDFRLAEAETAFVKAATAVRCDYNGSPYMRLALFYLQAGRTQEAWRALKQGQAQRFRREPHTLQQDQSFADRSIALMLLALGRADEAERFARKAYERPGRTGSTTDDERTHTLLAGLTLWTVLNARIELLREAHAAKSTAAGLAPSPELKALETEAWMLKRHMLKLLSDETFLNELIRPYMPGQDDKETWLVPSILRLLPPGVAVEALRQARASEDHESAVPYFDAFEAELALLRGEPAEALRLARQALEKLPPVGERLLSARVAAIGSEAAHQLGQDDESLTLANQALRDFPAVFRLLKISIPVRVEDDGSPLARRLAGRVLHSPRFRKDPAGFRMVIGCDGERVTLQMYRAAQVQHFEADAPVEGAGDDAVATGLKRLHERMMSPMLDLTAVDINSLDGAPAAAQAKDDIDGVLKGGKRK